MKKAKIAFWVVIFGFIGLILFQNREFYMSRHSLGIDLIFFNYHTPEIPNAIPFLGFFCIGLLISYFYSLIERFNSRKTIKKLSDSLSEAEKMLDTLKNENQVLKGGGENEPTPLETGVDKDGQKDSDAS